MVCESSRLAAGFFGQGGPNRPAVHCEALGFFWTRSLKGSLAPEKTFPVSRALRNRVEHSTCIARKFQPDSCSPLVRRSPYSKQRPKIQADSSDQLKGSSSLCSPSSSLPSGWCQRSLHGRSAGPRRSRASWACFCGAVGSVCPQALPTLRGGACEWISGFELL